MHNRQGSQQTSGNDRPNAFQSANANNQSDGRRFVPSNGVGAGVPAPKSLSSASVPPPRSASAAEIAAAMEEDRRTESGLSYLIREEKLLRENVPLSDLRTIEVNLNGVTTDTVALGIDGQLIIDRITAATRETEPLAPITVTTPLALYSELNDLEAELLSVENTLKRGSTKKQVLFKPVFVFDGASLNPKLNLNAGGNTYPQLPKEILEMRGDNPHTRASAISPALRESVAARVGSWDEDVLMFIITLLKQSSPDVYIAPYVGWGQLSAFFAPEATVISDVWGCLELLAFPYVDRVITRIDVEKGVMDVVVKQDVIDAINRRLPAKLKRYNEVSFGEWVMLDTIRPPYRLPFLSQPVENVLERFSYTDSGDGFAKQQPKTEYTTRIQANLAVLDTPVMSTAAGGCAPLYRVCNTKRHTNLSLQEAYGVQLPLLLYYFLHVGHMSPSLWASMGQHMLVDRLSPLDTPDLRDDVTRILTLRIHAANQLSQCVENSLSPTEWYREYGNDSTSLAKLTRLKRAQSLVLDDWPLLDAPAINAIEKEQIYFLDVLPFTKKGLPASENPKGVYHTAKETCADALLKTLDLLGYYIHSADATDPTLNEETGCSRALACFESATLSEYALVFIELLRTGALHDNPIKLVSVPPVFPPIMVDGVRLACRTVSIIPLNLEQAWSGPVDVEMAAFGAISRRYQTSIKTIVHAIAASTMFSGRSSVPMDAIGKVTELLPFRYPLEFGAGVVMQYVLVNNIRSYDAIQRVFPEMSSVQSDLTTLFYFWQYAFRAMGHLHQENIPHFNWEHAVEANKCMCEAALRLDPEGLAFMNSN